MRSLKVGSFYQYKLNPDIVFKVDEVEHAEGYSALGVVFTVGIIDDKLELIRLPNKKYFIRCSYALVNELAEIDYDTFKEKLIKEIKEFSEKDLSGVYHFNQKEITVLSSAECVKFDRFDFLQIINK